LRISYCNDHCLKYLIDKAAEVNVRDHQNNTPLHILGHNSQYSYFDQYCLRAAEKLIKAGADLTAVNNEGKTPMENEFVKELRKQKLELFQVNHV
jgi:ankyrin repeat protein